MEANNGCTNGTTVRIWHYGNVPMRTGYPDSRVRLRNRHICSLVSRACICGVAFSACSRFHDESRQADIVVGTDGSGDFETILSSAPGSPKPKEITAAWTFNGKWNPENEAGPAIQQLRVMRRQIALVFSESVTVKGKPQLKMCSGEVAKYVSGSGGETLLFELASDSGGEVCAVDLNGGAIIACEASAVLRAANPSLRAAQKSTTKL